ncbi:MAG: amidohydrolase family protein, partial [Acidobacteria bacterium]|nr:amidohydrolase family protein [Acidobacteriota bacterium]
MSNVTSGKAAAVRWSRPLALVLLCVLLTSCTRTKTPPALAPDWILHHGKVFTVDRDFRIAQAVAVKDDEFVAVGSDEEVLALAGDRTRLMDLEGKAVLPGIIDSHVHALSYGLNASRLTFAVTPVIHTVESMLQVVKTKAQAAPKGSWIAGRGPFSLDFVREGRLPTRWELDQVAPDHPVYINMQGHVGLANSLALKLAGITRNTPDPKGGKIVRDPKSGEPNGLLLEEFAWGPVARLLPQFGRSDLVEAVRTANRLFNEAGITSVVDPDGGVEESRDKMDALEEVWRNKEMTARWHVLYRFRGTAFADK